MASKIVDLSARSKIINAEPFHLHFWEVSPEEFHDFILNPRKFLANIGIKLPADCRIETFIENHDWLIENAPDFKSNNGTIICNVGGGNVAKNYYRVTSYAHDHKTVGKYKKELLHSPEDQERS